MASTSTNELLSIEDAAPLLGISTWSVRELCKQRALRYMRVGPGRGVFRFRREWLNEYLAAREVEPAPACAASTPLPPRPLPAPVRREVSLGDASWQEGDGPLARAMRKLETSEARKKEQAEKDG